VTTPEQTSKRQAPDNEILPPSITLWRTAQAFEFLRAGMAMSAVTNVAGVPDRQLGSGQLRWEYDLTDGSQMVILPVVGEWDDLSTWHVAWWGQRRFGTFMWSKPADYK
jgi:hypothetical protein